MSTLGGLLNHLRARLEGTGIPFVVGGAFALAARGFPRFTDDVDIMVLTKDPTPVQRALGPPRFEMINEVTFRDNETGLWIDVIPVLDEAQRAVFDDALVTPLHGASGIRVLTAEGLAVMLLREATGGDARMRATRLRDIEVMAADGKLDWQRITPWVRRMGYAQAYEDVRAEGKPPLRA